MIDPTIVSDGLSSEELSRVTCGKHELYCVDQVRSWCAGKLGFSSLEEFDKSVVFEVHGIPITWRGLIHWPAYEFLRKQIRMPADLLSLVAVRTLTSSWGIWKHRTIECTM